MIKAVTFDLWRTLFIETAYENSVQLSNARMLAILGERGLGVGEAALVDALEACRSLAFKRQKIDGIDFIPEEQIPWILSYLHLSDENGLAAALLVPYTTSLLEKPPRLVEGTAEVLARLSNDYKLALICNTGRTPGRVVREVMQRFDILRYFTVTVFSNELGIAKPNPRIFIAVLEGLGVAPAEAIHVGDDPITDVGGARSSGMRAIWFNPYGETGESEYDFRISSLAELIGLGAHRFV
jgi:FMN phosphatase YigB (HAD superfamily)